MADGFLGRWSQRKQAVRTGQTVEEPAPTHGHAGAVPAAEPKPTHVAVGHGTRAAVKPDSASDWGHPPTPQQSVQPQPDQPPAPTLADVAKLKPEDSFARFLSPDVAPDVRNAAMKKLFADPHYNVMDGLDIYIDDYSIPSPLPVATLRQMASAKFLNLFEEEPPVALATPATSTATLPNPSPTESAAVPPPHALIEKAPDDHLDLRLQPDHAAGPKGIEREPEREPDAARQPVPPPSH